MLFAYEQLILASITRSLAPNIIVEFGTGRGSGTFVLAANSPDDARVLTVDLAPAVRGAYTQKILRDHGDIGLAYRSTPQAGKITQLYTSSGVPLDPALIEVRKRADLIYVDGDHGYEGVKADTLAAVELAAPKCWVTSRAVV